MDCSPPGSSVHGILQARILEWVAIPFSSGSSWPNGNSCIFGAWCIMDIHTNCWIQEWMSVDCDFDFFPYCLFPLSAISYSTARFVFSISARKMDVFAAAVVLNINCFVWNVDDFPKDVLLEKCCLSLKDFHHSWQQKDAVAGSTGQWLGPLSVAELGKESIILHPQSWLCPEIWEMCLTCPHSSLSSFRLYFPVIGRSGVACHFPGHVMPWQSKLLIPSHGTAPLTWELGTLDAWVLSHGLCFTLGNMCNLAHFSDRLSLCLPCPWGEIWLHLGNKLENWAIIEWIRSMWAVSLSSVGQNPSE